MLRTQRNMRIHFAIAAAVLVAALGFGVEQARADRAAARDLVRARRGDGQHGGRGGDRRRDDVVRPDGEAREGHRRRRRPDRGAERRRGRLPRLLGRGRDPQLALPRPPVGRAGRAHARRARAHGHPRDRDEGATPGAGRRCAAAFRPGTPRSRSRAGWR